MLALVSKEYGFTLDDFLSAEPTYINALYAAACESGGMLGEWTFLDMEIQKHAKEIKETKKFGNFIVLDDFVPVESKSKG